MQKNELVEIMQHIADKMSQYSEIRHGGNLGTSIAGMLISNGLSEVAKEIKSLNETIQKNKKDSTL